MMSNGELVEKREFEVSEHGKKWYVDIKVYHRKGEQYNVKAEIREKAPGFFSRPDVYYEWKYNVKEGRIEDKLSRLIDTLFGRAEDRERAREMEIDFNVREA
jgi:hypothetical protein